MIVEVAIGIVFNSSSEVLITQRPLDKSHGGFWEFPGGKLEPGEEGKAALKRELYEEVNIQVKRAEFLTKLFSEQVALFVYLVTEFEGQAKSLEGQLDLKWVNLEQLSCYSFPKVNEEIIKILYRMSFVQSDKRFLFIDCESFIKKPF